MSNQPEALRLADRCESLSQIADAYSAEAYEQAAAELRRLSAENESLRQIVQDFPPVEAELREVSDRAHRLEAQRDALLEALRAAVADWDEEVSRGRWLDAARAAIKAVEEGK